MAVPLGAGVTGAARTRERTTDKGWRAAKRSWQRHWELYLLMAVPLLWFAVFKYVPMTNAVLAFKDYHLLEGVWGSPWVGLKHFEAFVSNPVALTLVKNTFVLSGYVLLASFPIPIILALALNEVRNGLFKRSVQMITYAPYFISTVVVVSMTILILSPQVGLLNDAFGLFGVPAPDMLGRADYFRHIYVWSDVWQTAGYSAVIYLAALAGIDPGLYEAARVDGASRLQRIRHVDIPGILPTAVIILILSVGNVMAIGFEKAFLLQNPLNLAQSEIIATYVYKVGVLSSNFSLGTAVGLFNSVVNLALLIGVNAIAKRVTGSGLW
ncbi:ABC transporter permease [Ruania alba]|uniref:Carbohydrate ABC transporter membrane protein 1, CUT1 family n=1 Tax=Ruania alba TaxID=648782 RepID=A0A1H5BDM4_9MICO|nr:ABC transporter permease subunit [Ruania alba]SED52672.1 carbohydrate ABC transporter membrane protein 1, CUT1 family [Ruania alba]